MVTSTSAWSIVVPALVLDFEHPEEAFQHHFPTLVPVVGVHWLQAPAKLTHHDATSCANLSLWWVLQGGAKEEKGK